MNLSVVIPAHNEEEGVRPTVERLYGALMEAGIPCEILVVNDHSTDGTEQVLQALAREMPGVRYVNNPKAGGFGRAIQTGLERFRGDAVCIVMADASDDPRDVVAYYRKLEEGYDCVFGSRFVRGSRVVDYPAHKLLVNRLANAFINALFRLHFNDTTNAFKAYRREVIEGVKPFLSPHFNITVELPLKAITRGYTYATVPINWYNRATGVSKLKIKEMGSRYLFIVLYVWLEQLLSRGDYRRQQNVISATVPTQRVEALAMTETLPRISTQSALAMSHDHDDHDDHDLSAASAVASPPAAMPDEVSASSAPTPYPAVRPTAMPASIFLRLAYLAAFLVPIALLSLILWGIWTRTPQAPFWDEWQNVDMVLHFKQGTLQFADFWAFHNEHRIVIPRMIDLALIDLSHWNEQVMMTFDVGLAVAEAGLLLAAVRRGLNSTRWMFVLVAPISLLLFSLGQYENWLWSFQITFICTVVGVACCVYGFARQPASWEPFLLALIGAFVASWSSVGGTMAWIAFLPAAWRAGRSKGIVWTITAAAVLITYFQGFPHQSPFHFSLGMFGFALGYLGAPLGGLSVKLSLVCALLSVVFVLTNLVVYWRTHDDGASLDAWLGLALFALAVDGVTTLGRYNLFGFRDFLTSRYQVFSVLWWVAVLVLATINIRRLSVLLRSAPRANSQQRPRWSWARTLQMSNLAAIALCCVALIAADTALWGTFKSFLYTQRLDEICVANYQTAPDACLRGFIWDPAYLRTEAKMLDEYHLSIFANDVGTTRPLIVYMDKQTGDQWVTTTLLDSQSGYTEERWLGLLYVNAHVGAQPLYQCLSGATHSHFLSLQETCEGQRLVGLEGWVDSAPSATDTTTALYRCSADSTSFVWLDSTCDGHSPAVLLGYIISQSTPWQG